MLWILSTLPGKAFPEVKVPFADKVVHFGLFFVGAVLLGFALRRTWALSFWKHTALVVIALALVGVGDEWHQMSTPNRSGNDWGDWTADCAGALTGALVIGWIYARTQKRFPLGPDDLAAQGD